MDKHQRKSVFELPEAIPLHTDWGQPDFKGFKGWRIQRGLMLCLSMLDIELEQKGERLSLDNTILDTGYFQVVAASEMKCLAASCSQIPCQDVC